MNNFDSDPEDFAKTFCDDLGIQDPEVGVSKATTLLSVLPLYLIRLNVDSSRPTLPYSLQPAVAFAIREQLYEVTTFTAYLPFLLLFFFFLVRVGCISIYHIYMLLVVPDCSSKCSCCKRNQNE